MLLSSQNTTVRIKPRRGDAVIINANCWNKPDWSQPGQMLAILFGQRQIGISLVSSDGAGEEPQASTKARLPRPIDGPFSHLIAALAALGTRSSTDKLPARLVEALLYALLHQLEIEPEQHYGKAQRTYDAICLHVQENSHLPITRESVAEVFELSPSYVSRLFRREGSTRFSDYLNSARINRAKLLLEDRRAPIKEIARNCGYQDTAYFCRLFRRSVSMTPTEYRSRKE